MGRMPESHKAMLKTMAAAEVEAVLDKRPDLTVCKLADGAKDNWRFLTGALPDGVELIDFYPQKETPDPSRAGRSVSSVSGKTVTDQHVRRRLRGTHHLRLL